MKEEVIIVPKDKWPLDVLAEMEKRTDKARIFFDSNICIKLLNSNGCMVYTSEDDQKSLFLKWEATEDYPESCVLFEIPTPDSDSWARVFLIKTKDIAFFQGLCEQGLCEPDKALYFKMAE